MNNLHPLGFTTPNLQIRRNLCIPDDQSRDNQSYKLLILFHFYLFIIQYTNLFVSNTIYFAVNFKFLI